MRWFLFLCVLIKFVHLSGGECVTNGHVQNERTLFLVAHKTNEQGNIAGIENALNNKFYEACKDFFDIKFIYCNTGIDDILKISHKLTNIIDLNVPDHYKYPNLEHYGLLYAGDNGLSSTFEVNKVRPTATGLEITNGTVSYNNAKIMISSAESPLTNVYNFIMSIRYDGVFNIEADDQKCNRIGGEKDIVLVCTKDNLRFEDSVRRFAPLKVIISSECNESVDKLKSNLFGILTQDIFDADAISVPTIMYETPYLSNEILSLFPNAFILTTFRSLRYAFREFMVNADWMRAAIISDDSFYSLEFEKELIDMFEEEGISYIVEKCNTVHCSFTQALLTLSKSRAYLVVANIDRRNAKKLTNTYNSMIEKGIVGQRFLWLVREWRFSESSGLRHAFSISVGPAVGLVEEYRVLDLQPSKETIGIVEGLRHFKNAYNAVRKEQRGNQRNIMKDLEDSIKSSMKTCKGYVYQVSGNVWSLAAEMDITANGADLRTYKTIPRLSSKSCLVRGNYYNPCNNKELLFLLLVIIIFSISILMIMVYFHKSSPIKRSSYLHLN